MKNNISEKLAKPSPSSDAAIKRMKAAKPTDTAPEKALRFELQRKGLTFLVDERPIKELNRKADILFRYAKVAVFVDGCFWHGCPIHGTLSKANAEYWSNKIAQNKSRDLDTNHELKKYGWRVIRIWEHEDPELVSKMIFEIVIRRLRKFGVNGSETISTIIE